MTFRPYKIIYLILIHLFPKIGAGGGILFISKSSQFSRSWSIYSRYLAKGRHYVCAITIKFIQAACKNWGGRGLVSRASPRPSPREGRVWSTSHHGFNFVIVCHDFLGVLTTNDAHRHVVARACCARILTVHAHVYSVWRAPNSPARTASRLTANSIELLLTPCTACPLLTLQHKLMMRS